MSGNESNLAPNCEELESQPPVVDPQEVCPGAKDLQHLQSVQQVHVQEVDSTDGVEVAAG
jgi:hypothetical protein